MTKNHPHLNSILNSLNDSQRQAVTTIDGPVLVLAGPGTGKTQILASRIAYILSTTDTSPDSILALTFTESGVKAMRTRLQSLIGTQGLDVVVATFHGFAKSLIDLYPDYFTDLFAYQIATDLDRFKALQSILLTHHFDHIKPPNTPLYYLKELLSSISTLKREAVTPPVLKQLIELQYKDLEKKDLTSRAQNEAQKQLARLSEVCEVYYLYQHQLTTQKLYDFDDLINLTVKVLSDHDDLLLQVQERFSYFLIDEFQDTNNSQLSLLQKLASYWGQAANIFVVGDPNQSIYRFQGANMENILSFESAYPKAAIITLTKNYRSTDHILKTAHLLLSHTPPTHPTLQRAAHRLEKQSSHPELKPELNVFENSLDEYLYLKTQVQNLLSAGVAPKDIAIIVKTNDDALKPKQLLEQFGIPCQLGGGQNLFSAPSVILLLELLRLIDSLSRGLSDTPLFTVLSSPYLKLEPKDLFHLFLYSHRHKIPLLDLVESPDFADKGIVRNPQAFEHFFGSLQLWHQSSYTLSLQHFLQKLITDSGLLRYLESLPDSLHQLSALRLFLEFVQNQPSLKTVPDLLSQIDLALSQGLKITLESSPLKDALTITTVHKSKGLEWDHVFIPQCIDSRYGKKYDRRLIKLPDHILKHQTHEDLVGEDLRLFYVAITRAKKQLFLSYSQVYTDQSGKASSVIGSRFLDLLDLTATLHPSTLDPKTLSSLLSPPLTPGATDLSTILEDLTLSASDLNLYLDCSYKYLLEKIYKIPEAPNSILVFGTLIHSTLEHLYRHLKTTGSKPELSALLRHYHSLLASTALDDQEKLIRGKQGEAVLTAYLTHLDTNRHILFLEKYLGGATSPIVFSGIRLVGKIDQIDLLDESKKTVRIIDYKTGAPKSQGAVLGSTKDSDKHIYHQLLFYDLLTSLSPHFPYKAIDYAIDFVESPSRDDKQITRHLTFTQEEKDSFRAILEQVVKDIKSQHFPKTQDLSLCKLCRFKHHCHPRGLD